MKKLTRAERLHVYSVILLMDVDGSLIVSSFLRTHLEEYNNILISSRGGPNTAVFFVVIMWVRLSLHCVSLEFLQTTKNFRVHAMEMQHM